MSLPLASGVTERDGSDRERGVDAAAHGLRGRSLKQRSLYSHTARRSAAARHRVVDSRHHDGQRSARAQVRCSGADGKVVMSTMR